MLCMLSVTFTLMPKKVLFGHERFGSMTCRRSLLRQICFIVYRSSEGYASHFDFCLQKCLTRLSGLVHFHLECLQLEGPEILVDNNPMTYIRLSNNQNMEQYNNDITNNIKIKIKKTSNVNSVCQKPRSELKVNVSLKNVIQCGRSSEFVVSEGRASDYQFGDE